MIDDDLGVCGGRNFQDAYGHPASLYSFLAGTRNQRMVTEYQWRAPGEWFAEVYQVYYSEQENAPDAPVGGRLRSKDPEAANMIHNLVDQGHSAQGRPDGTSTPAPGTGTPSHGGFDYYEVLELIDGLARRGRAGRSRYRARRAQAVGSQDESRAQICGPEPRNL